MTSLKKGQLHEEDCICGGEGCARTPTYTPLLASRVVFQCTHAINEAIRGRDCIVRGKANDVNAVPLGTRGLFDVDKDLHYTGFRDRIESRSLVLQGAEFRKELRLDL
jgi:hypothetical protein